MNLRAIARDANLRGDARTLFYALGLLERLIPAAGLNGRRSTDGVSSLPRHWSRPSNGHLAWLKSRPVVAAAGVIACVADLHQHLGRLDAARSACGRRSPRRSSRSRRRLDVWHERSDEAPAPEHGATDMRLDDHFGSGSTLQRNERVKLAASFWNNVGAGMVIVGMAGAFFLDKPPGTWAKIGIAIGGLVLGWFCYSIASNILTYLHTLPEERR